MVSWCCGEKRIEESELGESELKGEKRSVDRRKGYKEHCSAFPWIWPELGKVVSKLKWDTFVC